MQLPSASAALALHASFLEAFPFLEFGWMLSIDSPASAILISRQLVLKRAAAGSAEDTLAFKGKLFQTVFSLGEWKMYFVQD